MSPILVRPVREQLEHDRVIRLLQTRFRRKYEAAINVGHEQNTAVGSGASALYPDLVLQSLERGRRTMAVVEVETGESVNHLEALAQWSHLGRLRVPFHLYVPSNMVEVARQLCDDKHIDVSELWTFHTVGDEVRFTLVHRSREAASAGAAASAGPKVKAAAKAATPKAVAKAAPKAAPKPKAKAKAPAQKRAKPAAKAVKAVARPVKKARRK